MPDLKRLFRETAGSSYYRSNPVEAARYARSKLVFARHRATPDEILAELGFDVLEARSGLEHWADDLDQMIQEVEKVTGADTDQGSMALDGALLLYGLVSSLKPEVVIETGVASGFSTAFAGAALLENGKGRLVSVDLPPQEGKIDDGGYFDWVSRPVGWAIPERIREGLGERHMLVLEDAKTSLPRLLEELGTIDMFVHDDLHTPDHMRWEFELVWPHLRPGGVVMSDDVNHGWLDFAAAKGLSAQAAMNTSRLAAVRKRFSVG